MIACIDRLVWYNLSTSRDFNPKASLKSQALMRIFRGSESDTFEIAMIVASPTVP